MKKSGSFLLLPFSQKATTQGDIEVISRRKLQPKGNSTVRKYRTVEINRI